MGFVGVYRAIYDYEPRSEGELAIQDGDLLFILDKSDDDDWWRAKKKATDDQDEEPEGLIPNNYIDEVTILLADCPTEVIKTPSPANFQLCPPCALTLLNLRTGST